MYIYLVFENLFDLPLKPVSGIGRPCVKGISLDYRVSAEVLLSC